MDGISSVPVRAVVTGHSNESGPHNFTHIYDYVDFNPQPSFDITTFEVSLQDVAIANVK